MKTWITLSMVCLLLAGCAASALDTTPPVESNPDGNDQPIFTSTPRLLPSDTPTSIPTPQPSPTVHPTSRPADLPVPVIHQQPGPLYDTILQIPVGEGGILYRGAGVTDMEPVGPNGIVVAPDGTIIIGDVYGNRLMRYDAAGKRLEDINLTELDILNISDMVGIGDSIYLLEISFKVLPERYRVSQLSTAGQLISQYDLPKGFHLEDELYGLAVGYPADGNPEVLIQLGNADTSRYFGLPSFPATSPEKKRALPVFGRDLQVQSASQGELAVLKVGNTEFESQMTLGGSLYLLSARLDGSYYLQREDLVAWEPIMTDITIHFVSPDGEVVGLARYPLMDWYFHIWRYLTVAPDGNVYGLITRQNSVDVLRLNFYPNLEPLSRGAVNPSIRSVQASSTRVPAYDCSKVRHLLPDSAQAKQVVASVITNYKQDRPTEYLGFEQIWSVDLLEDYAIIEGMVTPEETDIIIAQATERGYVMVSWYIGQLPIPGLRHGDIAGYFAIQLPEAPPELFYCLDLSRFTSGGQ